MSDHQTFERESDWIDDESEQYGEEYDEMYVEEYTYPHNYENTDSEYDSEREFEDWFQYEYLGEIQDCNDYENYSKPPDDIDLEAMY